jgi:hypothetical protein
MHCRTQNKNNPMTTKSELDVEKLFESIKNDYHGAAKSLLQNDSSLSQTQKERLSLIANRHSSSAV